MYRGLLASCKFVPIFPRHFYRISKSAVSLTSAHHRQSAKGWPHCSSSCKQTLHSRARMKCSPHCLLSTQKEFKERIVERNTDKHKKFKMIRKGKVIIRWQAKCNGVQSSTVTASGNAPACNRREVSEAREARELIGDLTMSSLRVGGFWSAHDAICK